MELDDLLADPHDPGTQAYRARIRTRFAELHEERERLEAQLKALAKTIPRPQTPACWTGSRSPETSCPG